MSTNLRICLLVLAMVTNILSLKSETVSLNFFANGEKIHTEHVASGGTYTLTDYISDASLDAFECRDYTFAGWKVGEPVQSDETPVLATTVTPTHNINLYAVFSKATVNRYVRITTEENLHAGSEYLIVCYYMYGGEPQYYAMGNEEGVYSYNSTDYYKISAERLYPIGGVIIEPDEKLIWKLSGSAGAWKWTNSNSNKGLAIDDNRKRTEWLIIERGHMLEATGDATPCNITVANGIFSIAHNSNGWALRYVDDDITETEDYFITREAGVTDNYPFYLYKKESRYTSYPDCEPWTVYLDAVDGTIADKEPVSVRDTVVEVSAGAQVTLPVAEKTDASCTGWVFAGWNVEEPIEGMNSDPDNLITGTYDPLYNGVTLHAVYKQVYYERVAKKSDIASGDVVVIATAGNKAVSSSMTGTNYYRQASVTVADGIITGEVADLEWTYDGTRFKHGSTYLSYDGTSSNYYYIYNDNFHFREDAWGTYYLIETTYSGNTVFGQSGWLGSPQNFYVYKKKVTYTSYPHCAPYRVTLYACGGTFAGGGDTRVLTEAAPGTGITLPTSVTPACDTEWDFYGWFEGEELSALCDTNFVDYHAPGTVYYPKSADEHLYAVYKRETDKFLIMHGLKDIVSDDTYLITHYARQDGDESENVYDWQLSSEYYDANHLQGVKGVAPQNGEGYYMQTSDSAVMWTLSGSNHDWAIQNLKNGEFLRAYSTGETRTQAEDHTSIVWDRGDGFALTVGCVEGSSSYYDIWYNGTCFATKAETSTSEGGKTLYSPFCYVYRREKEYASYPHCDPFTVYFDACGGSAENSSLTESAVYEGVELPEAYANSDCAKEGWTFVGWAEKPVTEETDLQTFDLYPPHTIYHPVSSIDTLYAVYHVKTNRYKRISAISRIHTGVNYIIAYVGASQKYALANLPDNEYSPASVTSALVTPDASQIIINNNDAIEWRLQGSVGEYELYNVERGVYLDLSEPGKALLPKTSVDRFDITYSDAKAYCVRSCMNLSSGDGHKYLGYSSSHFTTVTNDDRPMIYFYRQQSTYNSYPEYVMEVDALKWETNESGSYVYVESYHLEGAPDMHGGLSDPVLQDDGTYLIKYDPTAITPCSDVRVEWNGTSSKLKVPYVVSEDATASDLLDADCATCDVYVTSGHSLTIDADKEVHTITVTDGATLSVANGVTLSVNALVLFSEGDESAPVVNLNNSGSIVLEHGEMYHDRRIDESRYYWFTLPFDAKLKEISYSDVAANGKTPVYRQDFYLKYYDGARRTDDANAGYKASTYWTHVAPKGSDYTLRAGQGYNIGIADQAATVQQDGKRHAKRVLRFTMRPNKSTWLAQERVGGSKTGDVAPSEAVLPINAIHAGWNLIGNPFMHAYNTGSVGDDSGLTNGYWVKQMDAKGDWTGYYVKDSNPATAVPYFTLYDPNQPSGSRYSQVLAANHELRPFEAVFVQISEGEQINFATAMNVPQALAAYRKMPEQDALLYTGVMLSGNDRVDRAGIVLSEEYTPAYEIGADLAKQFNTGGLNLYTLNSDNHELAFNALSDEDATEAIPVGVIIPQAGTYTFAFDATQYNPQAVDTLQLIDAVAGTTTDLIYNDYTFTAQAGKICERFFLLVRRAQQSQNVATGAERTADENNGWTKIIRDGQLYLRRGNRIYDATGRKVQ
ncbi:MAG: InlB B-repeat-containing protein [Paludibacteraceae bacterium]|nr:InlB B-repeat-containing protein [Paludibacteraceae bacterium]